MLLKLLAIGALAAAGYSIYQRTSRGSGVYADSQPSGPGAVRDAGPGAMRDKPVRKWTKIDEESDQSFPASDPPANY